MCGETGNEIRFIRGDLLEIYFAVEDLEVEYIAKAYFSCIGAKILCELPYSEEQEAFCLRFPSKVSEEVKPGFYTYDLTLELVDGSKITLLHNEDFIVLKKRNTLLESEYAVDEGDNSGDDENGEPTEPVTPPEGTNPDEPSTGGSGDSPSNTPDGETGGNESDGE